MTVPDKLQELVRNKSKNLSPSQPLDPDSSLSQLGIGSLQIVELIVEIEDTYNIEIPLESLVPEMFASSRTIWYALQNVISQAE